MEEVVVVAVDVVVPSVGRWFGGSMSQWVVGAVVPFVSLGCAVGTEKAEADLIGGAMYPSVFPIV